mmetsp:Transcript_36812/g.113591  ORF Transcript_36812/g.113591 Transcript_36812/m.113591 type:complete len:188 (-) Transcript_36812:45-608(-)
MDLLKGAGRLVSGALPRRDDAEANMVPVDDDVQRGGARGKDGGKASDAKRICVPQKVDPKTFFANERTFLKWLNISTMLGMMGITLLNFADVNSDGAELAGLVLLPVAVLFMLYALMTFRARAHFIYMREPMRYDDTRGPTLLVVVLTVALLLATVFSLQRVAPARRAADRAMQRGGGIDAIIDDGR